MHFEKDKRQKLLKKFEKLKEDQKEKKFRQINMIANTEGSTCLIEDLERKEVSTSTLMTNSEAAASSFAPPGSAEVTYYSSNLIDKPEAEVIQVGAGSNTVASSSSPVKLKTMEDTDSSAVSTVSIGEMCKICHCTGEANVSLIAPCYCSGSLKYVHQECLQRWIKSSDIKRCELCKYPFAMQAKVSSIVLKYHSRLTFWGKKSAILEQSYSLPYFKDVF